MSELDQQAITAARLAMLQANADKHVAEAELARAQARQATAEAVQAESEAQQTLLNSDIISIQLDREREIRDAELALDLHYQVYNFVGPIVEDTVRACISTLTHWTRTSPEAPIEIVFTSPGGGIIAGFALWDFITLLKDRGHTVTTRALGMAASMAGVLLQAGDTRIMGKESWLLIHQGSFGAVGSYGEVEDMVEWVKKMQDRILNIFAEKSTLTKKQIQTRWTRKDWWLNSDEALQLGFVDEVR